MAENEGIEDECVFLPKPIFICDLCDLKFLNQHSLDRHNQLHAGTDGFACPLCKAIFPDLPQLQLHDLQHSLAEAQGNDDNFADFDIFAQPSAENVCIICTESFEREEDLLMHCMQHAEEDVTNHGDVTDNGDVTNDVQAVNLGIDEGGFVIPMEFRKNGLKVAKKSFARPSRPVSRRPPPSFEREKPTRVFTENALQQNYVMAEEDLYYLTSYDGEADPQDQVSRQRRQRTRRIFNSARNRCDQCQKVFSNVFSLKRHKSTLHLNKRPYVCTICRKTFMQMRLLLRHSHHHHTPREDIYTCKHCGGQFFELEHLHAHFESDHDLHHNCKACFRFFAEEEDYSNHMKEHTATYGFDCCRCRKRYKSEFELKKHRCIEEAARKYLCKVCGKCFQRKYHLYRHFSVHKDLAGVPDVLAFAAKIEYDSDGIIEEPVYMKPRNRNKVKPPKYDDIIHYKNGRRTMFRKPMNFKCYICLVKWPNLRRYKQHFMMAHKGIKFNSCHICGKQFSTAFRVRRHLSCHGIPDYVTETVLVNATEPEVQLQTSDETVYDHSVGLEEENEEDNIHARGRDYQCYICNQKCDNLRRFKLHFKKQHKTVEFNSCHICFKPFPTTFKVRRHIVSHYVEAKRSLESNINSDSDSSKSIIKKNANVLMNFGFVKIDARHRGIPKTYSCYICNENCENYNLYKRHFYSKHKGIKLNACHICNKQFTSTTKVKRHLQTHTNDRKYVCHACGKRFTQFAHLKRHQALMHTVRSQRLNKCMYCPKLYADKASFDKHVLMHQLAEQSNFKCSVCQEKFIEERLLDEHILAFHDFFKKFQCTVCKRRFQKESFLNRHMMIHTGLRKWKCFKCNKRFCTKSDLSRHAFTHTDLKPFPCFFCDKLFTRSSNRQKHISLFHDTKNIHVNTDQDIIKPSPD